MATNFRIRNGNGSSIGRAERTCDKCFSETTVGDSPSVWTKRKFRRNEKSKENFNWRLDPKNRRKVWRRNSRIFPLTNFEIRSNDAALPTDRWFDVFSSSFVHLATRVKTNKRKNRFFSALENHWRYVANRCCLEINRSAGSSRRWTSRAWRPLSNETFFSRGKKHDNVSVDVFIWKKWIKRFFPYLARSKFNVDMARYTEVDQNGQVLYQSDSVPAELSATYLQARETVAQRNAAMTGEKTSDFYRTFDVPGKFDNPGKTRRKIFLWTKQKRKFLSFRLVARLQ